MHTIHQKNHKTISKANVSLFTLTEVNTILDHQLNHTNPPSGPYLYASLEFIFMLLIHQPEVSPIEGQEISMKSKMCRSNSFSYSNIILVSRFIHE